MSRTNDAILRQDVAAFNEQEESISNDVFSRLLATQPRSARSVIVWSSFLFAILQGICTFFVTITGLRLAIGLGSLVVSAAVGTTIERWHQDWIRLSMLGLALLGSLLNLAVLMQLRSLRRRPASQWRQGPLSSHQIRTERIQLVLALATLVLIGIEEYLHFCMVGHL